MKAILIDDRIERQTSFIKEFNFSLEDYKDVLDNFVDNKYKEIEKNFENNNYSILKDFDIIMCHENAFDNINKSEVIYKIREFAKDNNKKLVFFSGGINISFYKKEYEYEMLKLNDKTLYSNNLKIFLDELRNNKLNILILAYGKKWKLNFLIEYLDNMSKYIQEFEFDDIYFDEFEDDLELNKLKEFGFIVEFDKEEITKDEMLEIKNKLANYIEEMIRYENYNS